ncbi:MAG: helix-turn-helix domain-containing protein [Treponema sp.]|nr:helix-turn-helix domain-containing protein [Treponema sp.]
MSETYFVKKHRKDNFTILDNTCIRDSNLSWKAKGVHTYLMSLPDDWKIHISEIVNHSCDGKAALYSAIQMLEQYGYIRKIRNRRKDGCFENTVYQVFEAPEGVPSDVKEHPLSDFPDVDNPDMENPVLDKRTLLTTNKLNTDKLRTKQTNSDCKSETEQSVFINTIKSLFGGEYPFDKNFEADVLHLLTDAGIEATNLEALLKYVFERTKLGNVKKSFTGLYRTLAFSKSIIRDFKNSSFFKKSEDSITVKCKLEYFDCPICSTRFEKHLGRCPECDLSINQLNDKSLPEYIVRQKLFKMTEEERGKYESELKKRREENKIKKGTSILAPDELIQFWTVCGLLNNQKEN